jgi:hypothetical protein
LHVYICIHATVPSMYVCMYVCICRNACITRSHTSAHTQHTHTHTHKDRQTHTHTRRPRHAGMPMAQGAQQRISFLELLMHAKQSEHAYIDVYTPNIRACLHRCIHAQQTQTHKTKQQRQAPGVGDPSRRSAMNKALVKVTQNQNSCDDGSGNQGNGTKADAVKKDDAARFAVCLSCYACTPKVACGVCRRTYCAECANVADDFAGCVPVSV